MFHATGLSRPVPRPARVIPRGAMSDLLSRIATDRSDEAFRKLFEDYGPRIRGYMMRQGADAALAEELAQETLLTVWRKAALYSADKGSATTWIFTIARNLRIDRLRRETPWQELTEEHAASIPSDDAPPDDRRLAAPTTGCACRPCLRELPPDQLEVVTLAFIDGLSHSEIAERLAPAAWNGEVAHPLGLPESAHGTRGSEMTTTIMRHPDPATLMSFAAGTLAEPLAAVVAAHLDMCAACRAEVADLELLGAVLMARCSAPARTLRRSQLPGDRRPARGDEPPAHARSGRQLPAPLASAFRLSFDTIPGSGSGPASGITGCRCRRASTAICACSRSGPAA